MSPYYTLRRGIIGEVAIYKIYNKIYRFYVASFYNFIQ
jgi:hypothetical protein